MEGNEKNAMELNQIKCSFDTVAVVQKRLMIFLEFLDALSDNIEKFIHSNAFLSSLHINKRRISRTSRQPTGNFSYNVSKAN